MTPAAPTVPADVPRTGPNTKPGEQPPVMPVVATQHTAAGAKAFAEFFMRTIDWAYATVNGAYMRHYSAACAPCRSIAATIDAAARKGHRYAGGRTTIRSANPGRGGPFVKQVVRVDSTAFEEVTSKGDFVTADRPYKNQGWVLGIRWSNSGWQITSIAVIR